jgi:hypothetical protein
MTLLKSDRDRVCPGSRIQPRYFDITLTSTFFRLQCKRVPSVTSFWETNVMPNAAFALLALLAADLVPSQPVDGKISWIYDYEEGKKLAQATGKPLFVVIRCER